MSDKIQTRATRMLRNIRTREYFTGTGWTGDVHEAQIFQDAGEAVRVCVEHRLMGVELAVRLSLTGPDLFCAPVR